jgi:replicative DNA helicase
MNYGQDTLAGQVFQALQARYQLHSVTGGEYRCVSPFRAGAKNKNNFKIKFEGPDKGVGYDFVASQGYSLFQIADNLGIVYDKKSPSRISKANDMNAAPRIPMPEAGQGEAASLSQEIEMTFLSALLSLPRSKSFLDRMDLEGDDFLILAHGSIFNHLKTYLDAYGEFNNPIVLYAYIKQHDVGAELILPIYNQLIASSQMVASGEFFAMADLIRHEAARRRMLTILQTGIEAIKAEWQDLSDIYRKLDKDLGEAIMPLTAVRPLGLNEIASEMFSEIEKNMQRMADGELVVAGIHLGYQELIKITGGIKGGNLIYLAGMPKRFKSTLMFNLALSALENDSDVHVLYFSLEMTKQEVMAAFFANKTGIARKKFDDNLLTPDEFQTFTTAYNLVDQYKLTISTTPHLENIKAEILQYKTLNRPAKLLVIVDYVQILAKTGKQSDTEFSTDVSRQLKAFTQENPDVAIIAGVQLNNEMIKGVENGVSFNAKFGIRGSGAFAQDANQVWFLDFNAPHEQQNKTPLLKLTIAEARSVKSGTSVLLRVNPEVASIVEAKTQKVNLNDYD